MTEESAPVFFVGLIDQYWGDGSRTPGENPGDETGHGRIEFIVNSLDIRLHG